MSIPFVRDFDFAYGRYDTLSPLIGRVIANNPGPFTYTGTGVYIIGNQNVAVIDPGPVLPDHMAALDAALEGRTVTHVLVTHHHVDHCPYAHPLADKHGCKVYGYGAPRREPKMGEVRLEAGDDLAFKPDIEIRGGEVFEGPKDLGETWTLEAIHTPGHTSNHICYGLREENTLFSGDHIMGWSTSVVSPPDGDMGDYLASLEDIHARKFKHIWPTHGPCITEPDAFVSAYIAHRHAREVQIANCLGDGLTSIADIVPIIYASLDKRLYPAAAHSVLAHINHMVETGRVVAEGDGLKGAYRLAG